jgi:hypothetical protein
VIKDIREINTDIPEGKLLLRAIGFIMKSDGFNSPEKVLKLLNNERGVKNDAGKEKIRKLHQAGRFGLFK